MDKRIGFWIIIIAINLLALFPISMTLEMYDMVFLNLAMAILGSTQIYLLSRDAR